MYGPSQLTGLSHGAKRPAGARDWTAAEIYSDPTMCNDLLVLANLSAPVKKENIATGRI